jgi:ABC-2 type transport system permease protein
MKIIAIAWKDLLSSLRSLIGLVIMIVIPLLVTGMFYFMFGEIATGDDYSLPPTELVIANLDEGGPRFDISTKNIPGGSTADTIGELIVSIAQSEDLAELLDVSLASDALSARTAVDDRTAQVAIIIPPDFSRQFADVYGQAEIEFYQDPTLTLGPGIVRSIISQFMDGMSGVKIAVDVAVEQLADVDPGLVNPVVQRYMEVSQKRLEDPEGELLEIRQPQNTDGKAEMGGSPLLAMVAPVMGGMLIFYAFNTGASTAQTILREEERRTLPRLFTTPTPQAAILSGKFLAVFLTVLVQVSILLLAARLIFGIRWGPAASIALVAAGIILAASSMGILINSFRQSTRHSGVVFGGLLTVTNMIGMISLFVINSSAGQRMSETVSLLVPQGWAARGMLQTLRGQPVGDVLQTSLVLLLWSIVFFTIGVWRFSRRYK